MKFQVEWMVKCKRIILIQIPFHGVTPLNFIERMHKKPRSFYTIYIKESETRTTPGKSFPITPQKKNKENKYSLLIKTNDRNTLN
jgi:hypothetical protein